MYIPCLITASYFYWAVKRTPTNIHPLPSELRLVALNVLLTELLYYYGDAFMPYAESFSLFRLFGFFILQDLHFYTAHYLFHKYGYGYHAAHHTGQYLPCNAWYTSVLDHFVTSVGSVAVPFCICNNPAWVLIIIIAVQIYTSVNGHTNNSKHSVHHATPWKRYGSIYCIDWLMDTY